MAKFEIFMPKMGESIIEATITRWLKKPGDEVQEEDPLIEIATDKVDSEIPSPVDGTLLKVFFEEGAVVPVGELIAIIGTEAGDSIDDAEIDSKAGVKEDTKAKESEDEEMQPKQDAEPKQESSSSERFYSPLVRNMARQENISLSELENMPGSGKDGRLTKDDLLEYIKNPDKAKSTAAKTPQTTAKTSAPPLTASSGDVIVEMDRMRKLMSDHMVMSKDVSPHVTSFIEIDCTNVVIWRNKVKAEFEKKEGEKITFTPIFVEAAAQALREFPNVNASVDGHNVIQRKNINIGLAAALPDGNLIVPVIKNADRKNLVGMAAAVNDIASRSRSNKLLPDEIQGGTFTITNLGTFGSLTGTPIINQPQVAILALGAIQKKAAVIETPQGDMIGIRHIMIMSLAYDHRIVDGALGGQFLLKMKKIIENFDINRKY